MSEKRRAISQGCVGAAGRPKSSQQGVKFMCLGPFLSSQMYVFAVFCCF